MFCTIIISSCLYYRLVLCDSAHSVPFLGNYEADSPEPLSLTPFIETGMIEVGRELAKVPPSSFAGNVSSYSGYFTVNKYYGSNLFFWFFPRKSNDKNAPLLLWLQGGPGASSMYGLFEENGPFVVTEKNRLRERYYSWHKNYNLLYIDSPVGAGFSFTYHKHGYATNQTRVAADLYEAVRQFYLLFPHLQKNQLVLTGESYAGKYVPALAHAIHERNPSSPDVKINLFGLVVGNPLINLSDMLKYSAYLYSHGLVDDAGRKSIQEKEESIEALIKTGEYEVATDVLASMFFEGNVGNTLFSNLTGIGNHYNFLQDKEPAEPYAMFLRQNDTKKALHVGSTEFAKNGRKTYDYMRSDIPKSASPILESLLENHYRVLIYVGQLDVICPYYLVENVLKRLQWRGALKFAEAERRIFKIGSYIAGYYKTASNLTEVLVRNAGHIVPRDKPQVPLALLSKFLSGQFDDR